MLKLIGKWLVNWDESYKFMEISMSLLTYSLVHPTAQMKEYTNLLILTLIVDDGMKIANQSPINMDNSTKNKTDTVILY